MKIKVIDLLNKIANGEELPKKIMYKGTTWEYKESEKDYSSVEWNEWLFDVYLITEILNDFIEILETEIIYNQDDNCQYQPYTGELKIKSNLDIKIEKLNIALFDDDNLTTNNKLKHIAFRVNELIDRWNNEK